MAILWYNDWEVPFVSGETGSGWNIQMSPAAPDSWVSISTEQSRAGSQSLKCHLDYLNTTDHNFRSQMRFVAAPYARLAFWEPYYFGFSIYVPNDWQSSSDSQTLMQIHTDDATSKNASPTCDLSMKNGKWSLGWQFTPVYNNPDSSSITDGTVPWDTAAKTNVVTSGWHDFAMEVVLGWTNSNPSGVAPRLIMYKDGVKVCERNAPTGSNCDFHYLILGQYNTTWKYLTSGIPTVSTHTYYYDEVRVSDVSLADVMIGSPAPTAPDDPPGYTVYNENQCSSTGTWTTGNESPTVGGAEVFILGETQTTGGGTGSNPIGTQTTPNYSTSGVTDIDVLIYAQRKPGRSPVAQWRLLGSSSGEIATGTWAQNAGENVYLGLGTYRSNAAGGENITVEISNAGSSNWVAVDSFAITDTPVVDAATIAAVTGDGVGKVSTSGTGTDVVVPMPSAVAEGTYVQIVIGATYGLTITPAAGFTAECAPAGTGSGYGMTSVVIYAQITSGFTWPAGNVVATLSTSRYWSADCNVFTGVHATEHFSVRDGVSHSITGGDPHKLTSGNAVAIAAVTTLYPGDAVIRISQFKGAVGDTPSGITSSKGGETELFKNITGRPFSFGTMEIQETAGSNTGATHTIAGATSDVAVTNIIVLRAATDTPVENGLIFPTTWEFPVSGVQKNSGSFTVDPIAQAPITGGTGTYQILAYPTTGCSVSVANNIITVSTNNGYADANAKLSIICSDGNQNIIQTVSYYVTNTQPVGTDQAVTIPNTDGNIVDMTGWATDADNDPITMSIEATSTPSGVSATITDGVLTLDANGASDADYDLDFQGTDDSASASVAKTLVVTVKAPASNVVVAPPTFTMDVQENSSDNVIDLLPLCTDNYGLPLSYYTVDTVSCALGEIAPTPNGTCINEDGYLLYAPDADYTGDDDFDVVVTDGTTQSGNCAVTVTVLSEGTGETVTATQATVTGSIRLSLPSSAVVIDLVNTCGLVASLGNTLIYTVTIAPSVATINILNGVATLDIPYGTRETQTAVVNVSTSVDTTGVDLTISYTPVADSPTGWRVFSLDTDNFVKLGTSVTPNIQKLASLISSYTPDVVMLQGVPMVTGGELTYDASGDICLGVATYDTAIIMDELVTKSGMSGYVLGSTSSYITNAILYKGTLVSGSSNAMTSQVNSDSRNFVAATVQNSNGKIANFICTTLSDGSQAIGSNDAGSQARQSQLAQIHSFAAGKSGLTIIGGNFKHIQAGVISYDQAESLWDSAYNLATNAGASTTYGSVVDSYLYVNQRTGLTSVCSKISIIDDDTYANHKPVYGDFQGISNANISRTRFMFNRLRLGRFYLFK